MDPKETILKIFIKERFQKVEIPILPSKRARKIPEKIEVFKQPEQGKMFKKEHPKKKIYLRMMMFCLEELKRTRKI